MEKGTFFRPFCRSNHIILGNILEYLEQPEETVLKLMPYLKEKGVMIISISKVFEKDGQASFVKGNQIKEKIQHHSGLVIKNIKENKVDYILQACSSQALAKDV